MSEKRVPWVDLQDRWQEERDDLVAIFERTGASGQFVGTDQVAAFEEKVCRYTGARHCVGLNSGTDGLIMALWAAGIGAGDEVITSPNSFIATAGAVVEVGGKPVFADVLPDQTLNPAAVEAAITPRTRAILPVHWTGRISDMDALLAIAERHDLVLIEDSAQTMGAWYRGKHGGRFGIAGAFSCHPLKNLNAMGDAGFLLTDDDEVAERIRLRRNHGLADRDTCVIFGVNSRLDALQAEILSYRLDKLDAVVEARRRNAARYQERIRAAEVFIPDERPDEKGSYVLFIVQAEDRERLREHLEAGGIDAPVYYGTPLHLQPAAKDLGYQAGDLPEVERQAARVLALPHHQYLSEDQIDYVAESVNSFYGA